MPYDPNSPMAAQLLSVSQPIIQGNFAIIQNSFDVNHIDFGAGTDNGKHKFAEFPVALTNPIPPIVFPAGEIALYGATNAVTAVNELYVNKTNQATVVQVPMTASILSLSSVPAPGNGGWTYLPSGLVLVIGNAVVTTPVGFNGMVTVTIAIPIVLTSILSVVACPFQASTNDVNFAVRVVDVGNPTASSFRLFVSSRTAPGAAPAGLQVGYQYTVLCVPQF